MPKKVVVNPSRCTGCGTCAVIAPDVFVVDGSGGRILARIKEGADIEKYEQDIEDAIEDCPEGAISWYKEENQ